MARNVTRGDVDAELPAEARSRLEEFRAALLRWEMLERSLGLPALVRTILGETMLAALGDDARSRFARGCVERYQALAREAQTSGDRIAAENFFQHAEHYFRVMNAQGEGFQGQPRPPQQQMSADNEMVNGEGEQPEEQHQGRDRQYNDHQPPDHQPHDHQPHDHQVPVQVQHAPPPPPPQSEDDDQLPSFITGRPE